MNAGLVPGGQVAGAAAAVQQVHAQALYLAAGYVCPEGGRGLQDTQGYGVAVDHGQGPCAVGQIRDFLGAFFENAQVGGVLDEDRRGPVRQLACQVCKVDAAGAGVRVHGDQAEGLPAVIPELGGYLGIHGCGNQDFLPAGYPGCHPEGRGGGLSTVEGGVADHIHVQQFAHQAGVFKNGLQLAVVGIGVPAVGGDELRAAVDLVADGWHVMPVAACTQEAELVLRTGAVTGQLGFHMLAQCLLRWNGFRKTQGTPEAELFRYDCVQFLDVRDADPAHHFFPDSGDAVGHGGVHEGILVTHAGPPSTGDEADPGQLIPGSRDKPADRGQR
jgi:hypothetical protein